MQTTMDHMMRAWYKWHMRDMRVIYAWYHATQSVVQSLAVQSVHLGLHTQGVQG